MTKHKILIFQLRKEMRDAVKCIDDFQSIAFKLMERKKKAVKELSEKKLKPAVIIKNFKSEVKKELTPWLLKDMEQYSDESVVTVSKPN